MQAREDAASMVEVRTFKDHYEENKHIIYTIKGRDGKEDTVIPDRDPLSDQSGTKTADRCIDGIQYPILYAGCSTEFV